MKRRRTTPTPHANRAARACALGTATLAALALPASAAAAPGSGSGSGTVVWLLAAVGAAVLVFALMRLRAGRQGAHHSITDIADGRELLIARGRRVTEELTDLTEPVAEREDEAATRQHQRALDVVASARSRIGRASGQRVQAKAHQELDEAEWLVGVLRARLDGFVEPLQPRPGLPATCFFDGSHGLATVEIDLEGIALQRIPVRSCAACAVGLVRGERPRVGSISIGGRSVPWPAAPSWCGSYAWAAKDLRHLHYDGTPLFAEPERPAASKRQTVAERARSVRSRVLPVAPEVLPEDEPGESHDDFEAFVDTAEDLAVEQPQAEELQGEESAMSSAFNAMEGETPPTYESTPLTSGESEPD